MSSYNTLPCAGTAKLFAWYQSAPLSIIIPWICAPASLILLSFYCELSLLLYSEFQNKSSIQITNSESWKSFSAEYISVDISFGRSDYSSAAFALATTSKYVWEEVAEHLEACLDGMTTKRHFQCQLRTWRWEQSVGRPPPCQSGWRFGLSGYLLRGSSSG